MSGNTQREIVVSIGSTPVCDAGRAGSKPAVLILLHTLTPWRNWYTRWIAISVPSVACGFKSRWCLYALVVKWNHKRLLNAYSRIEAAQGLATNLFFCCCCLPKAIFAGHLKKISVPFFVVVDHGYPQMIPLRTRPCLLENGSSTCPVVSASGWT